MEARRGVRNNNPGNLRKNDTDKWQGLSPEQTDPAFFVFQDPVWGIRALAVTLIAYQDKHGLNTIRQHISRFAPPSDNNPTDIYIENVAAHAEVGAEQIIDVHDYRYIRPEIEAIITQECATPWSQLYSNAQIDKGLLLAGIQPLKKSVIASAQVVGSAITATAIAAQPVIESAKSQIEPLIPYADWLKYAFLGLSFMGILLVVIAKINERRKGIS